MLISDLDLRDYDEVLALQHRYVSERIGNDRGNSTILCQHPGVYTIGRSSQQKVPPNLPYPLRVVERGGDITWHGPGQIVGYPILRLADWGLGVREYMRALEDILSEAVADFGARAVSVRGLTGLWVGRQKIASIGVAVRRGVSYHGFALNVNNSTDAFGFINPCKLEAETMTTLAAILGRPVDESRLTRRIAEGLMRYFPSPTNEKKSAAQKILAQGKIKA